MLTRARFTLSISIAIEQIRTIGLYFILSTHQNRDNELNKQSNREASNIKDKLVRKYK